MRAALRRDRWALAAAAFGACLTVTFAQGPEPPQTGAAAAAPTTLLSQSQATQPAEGIGRKGVCYASSMAAEAIAIRLADKMMFASGPGPLNSRPRRAFARACYTLK